jgi:hypothetical protein
MKKLLLSLSAFFVFITAKADSPLTSTDLARGYQDNKYVIIAKNAKGIINDELVAFLASGGNIAEKMAVINTLSWGDHAMSNAKIFHGYLIDKKKSEEKFNPSDNLCLAYLLGLGNYFKVTEAKKYAELAVAKNSKSFTFQIILALIKAQEYFETDWCMVYRVCADVKTNTGLKQDMAPSSVTAIFEYIDLYKNDCKGR